MAERAGGLHPNEYLLQPGSLPSIWCPGCGIGTVVNTFIQAVGESGTDPDRICVVSGIGCTGKIAYSLKFNSFQAIYCNPVRCASDLKLRHPDSRVVVFVNDVDLMVSDAGDFIGIGKKGQDLLVIYINTFIYRVFIEGKALSRTPFAGVSADNSVESPFNIPHLAQSCGSHYIARWTPLHVRRLMYSISETLQKPGFSVIEVISPCLMYYASSGIIEGHVDRMKFLHDNSIIKHDESIEKLDIRMQEQITLGRFVNE